MDEVLSANKRRRDTFAELLRDCRPTSLLDPEIGDEGVDGLLRRRAEEQLTGALNAERGQELEPHEAHATAVDAVRAIALLDGLARRRLYKTAFTMDAKQFKSLAGLKQAPDGDVERRLAELIRVLRTGAERRSAIENAMVRAAGWPEGAVLLYVPGRKSQAKGIETGALADGTGRHAGRPPGRLRAGSRPGPRVPSAVASHRARPSRLRGGRRRVVSSRRRVRRRAAAGRGPNRARRGTLRSTIVPGSRTSARLTARRRACSSGWRQRAAGFRASAAAARLRGPDATRQLALGAALAERIARTGVDDAASLDRVLIAGPPDTLEQRIDDHVQMDLRSALLAGEADVEEQTRALQRALDVVADELQRDGRSA